MGSRKQTGLAPRGSSDGSSKRRPHAPRPSADELWHDAYVAVKADPRHIHVDSLRVARAIVTVWRHEGVEMATANDLANAMLTYALQH